jgi:polysaccharide export outer membrane protein
VKLKKLTVISLSLLAFTAGCTVIPGSGLSTSNKTIVYNENDTAESIPRSTAG